MDDEPLRPILWQITLPFSPFNQIMHAAGPKNPLHGITLEKLLTQLVEHYGWDMLGRMIQINCFNFHPSIKSSLVFLRRTPWARAKVEELYIDSLPDMQGPPLPAEDAPDPETPSADTRPPPTDG